MNKTQSPFLTRLIEKEKQSLQTLQKTVDELRSQVEEMEGKIESLGGNALTMPEDLGDWSKASPRVQGIVSRIKQTHQLSIEVNALTSTSTQSLEKILPASHVSPPCLPECEARHPPTL